MSIEHTDISAFLAELPPFDCLTEVERSGLLRHLDSVYINAQNHEQMLDQAPAALYLLHTAVIDLIDQQGEVSKRLEPGDLFGRRRVLGEVDSLPPRRIQQDGILYRLPAAWLRRLLESNREFAQRFQARGTLPLRPDAAVMEDGVVDWTQTPVNQLVTRTLVSVPITAAVQEAAVIMSEAGVSCVPVVDERSLVGLITDRDLRNRVLALGLDGQVAVADIMSRSPLTIQGHQTLFDALALISAHNIHHLPVVNEQGEPMGVLTTTDLLHQQRNAPMLFMKALHKADSRTQLIATARDLPAQIRSFAALARDAATAGRLLATLTDTLTRRLIGLWIAEQGDPPVAWCWLAFGSQAREDQTLYSDQDNGLLVADDASEDDLAWFGRLADYVCTGLADCGIPLCPGDIMARNPRWCRRQADWYQIFRQWVEEPTPKSIMHCMIFFDSRCVAGNTGLYRRYREQVAELGQAPRFLAMAATHVDELNVPLGLFDRLLGRDQSVVDIKTQGIAVINDIVRLHALQHGLTMPGTLNRLQALTDSPHLARSDIHEWADAWRFMTSLRLRWQLEGPVEDNAPNQVATDWMSNLERRQLKLALRVLKEAQRGLILTFRGGF